MEQQTNTELTPLLHAISTAQILHDELGNIENVSYYKGALKKATDNWISVAKKKGGVTETLAQIWSVIPESDYELYIEAKSKLIRRLQNCSFDTICVIESALDDADAKYKMLDIFELVLNTHCVPSVRDLYREKLGYTLEQYEQLKPKLCETKQ